MIDDGHEDLFGGVWPFVKRALFLFLPFWVCLIVWYAGVAVSYTHLTLPTIYSV